jgi:hypothetical protein
MSKLLLVRHECLSFYLSKVDKQITKDEDLFPARQHKLGFIGFEPRLFRNSSIRSVVASGSLKREPCVSSPLWELQSEGAALAVLTTANDGSTK